MDRSIGCSAHARRLSSSSACSTPIAVAKPPPTPAAKARAVVPLGLLHHVAQREIALGLLAQVAAVRPETMRFATELEKNFRLLDRRILAIAEALGIGEESAAAGVRRPEHPALDGQADELQSSLLLRGGDFDRQFWVTVARDQLAASTLLATSAGTDSVPRPSRRRDGSPDSIDPFATRRLRKPSRRAARPR